MRPRSASRRLGRLLGALALLLAGSFAMVAGAALLWPVGRLPDRPGDAIVCLGAGMSYRGWHLPDAASARRARACAAAYRGGAAPVIVFTGFGHQVYSAAEAMADVARAEGVPETAIRIEPRALSTIQNADFTLALLPEDARRLVVVSDGFHLPRSWAIFRLLGVRDVALVAAGERWARGPGERSLPRRLLRETGAIWVNVGRLSAYAAGGVLGIPHDRRIAWFD